MEDLLKTRIATGKNLFLHGAGGTGKTWNIRKLYYHCISKMYAIYVTCTTGMAALNINMGSDENDPMMATTFHSWAGVGLGKESVEVLVSKIRSKFPLLRKIKEANILVIDEISMFGGKWWTKMDAVMKDVRENDMPFGGLQLVLSGDLYQLPPVNDDWIFESKSFLKMEHEMIDFTECKRFANDVSYFHLLLRTRQGKHTADDIKELMTRVDAYRQWEKAPKSLTDIIPTYLYCTRDDVEMHNRRELDKLSGEEITFTAVDQMLQRKSRYGKLEYYSKILEDAIPKDIKLKVGAQVMLKANLDVAGGLANGSRGVVISLGSTNATVKFWNGKVIVVSPYQWECSLEDRVGRTQIPLILAWASTVHKCQGSTLDCAILDIGGKTFAPGQGYVALSRVKNIKGLYLKSFDPNKLYADPKVVAYLATRPEYSGKKITAEESKILIVPSKKMGKLRIGTIQGGKRIKPSYKGFTLIEVMTASSKYGSLGPYVLKDENGRIMENIWQFSKVYPTVAKSRQIYSRWDPKVIWEWPEEEHTSENRETITILDAYWKWRQAGEKNEYAVRYPVGIAHRHEVLFCLKRIDENTYQGPLDYVEARCEIYIPEYARLVKKQAQYADLVKRLASGENLLIAEVDGPIQTSIDYYVSKYGIPSNTFENWTCEPTLELIKILIEDTKHSFGHGYCLAMCLMGLA
jgi:ATP-dependent DNA helicase PIF1